MVLLWFSHGFPSWWDVYHLSTGGILSNVSLGDQQEQHLGAGEAETAECGWGDGGKRGEVFTGFNPI